VRNLTPPPGVREDVNIPGLVVLDGAIGALDPVAAQYEGDTQQLQASASAVAIAPSSGASCQAIADPMRARPPGLLGGGSPACQVRRPTPLAITPSRVTSQLERHPWNSGGEAKCPATTT